MYDFDQCDLCVQGYCKYVYNFMTSVYSVQIKIKFQFSSVYRIKIIITGAEHTSVHFSERHLIHTSGTPTFQNICLCEGLYKC